MTTVEELEDFCKEPCPVGAILLSGEWGCGKTYLIEETLANVLKDTHIIIRISLFGISSIAEINERVKEEWFCAYLQQSKSLAKANDLLKKIQKKLRNVTFLPDKLRDIAEFDPAILFDDRSKIGERKVVLVFDDLERTGLDTVDVLGCINEYCENKRYHTIIVANEDRITSESCIQGDKKVEGAEPAVGVDSVGIQYREIKEKVIQRTVRYQPDYPNIVSQIISDTSFRGGEEYKSFLKSCESEIQSAFASEVSNGPHNIRSLKCALQDFYRVYVLVKQYGLDNLPLWLSNFITYMLAFKANIAQEDPYGGIFIGEEIKKIFPQYNGRYMMSTVERWIIHGDWDKVAVEEEIKEFLKQQEARDPFEILKSYRITEVDECLVEDHFHEVLCAAYAGQLTLDEYVILIENSCQAREFGYSLKIDWEKVRAGLKSQIEQLKKEMAEPPHYRHDISASRRSSFSEEEWKTYSIIRNIREDRELVYSRNRKLHCKNLTELGSDGFLLAQNKMYDVFDQEMAEATFKSFKECDNAGKTYFPGQFDGIWGNLYTMPGFKTATSIRGLEKLLRLLHGLETEYEQNKKMFSRKHTEIFMEVVQRIVDNYNSTATKNDDNHDSGDK